MSTRVQKQPKSSLILERVRALSDRDLAGVITGLRFNTKLEQATLAKALQEQKRRQRLDREAPAA